MKDLFVFVLKHSDVAIAALSATVLITAVIAMAQWIESRIETGRQRRKTNAEVRRDS